MIFDLGEDIRCLGNILYYTHLKITKLYFCKMVDFFFNVRSWIIVAISCLVTACTDPLLKPAFIITHSPDDIRPVDEKWVRPFMYDNKLDFQTLPVDQKKEKFIHMMLPAVLVVKHNLSVLRQRVGDIMWKSKNKQTVLREDSLFLSYWEKKFKADNPEDLFSRLATHPTSIVLAQAALESGWGSSRFFREANNVFGIWSYNADESRIQAAESRGDNVIYLRSYPDLSGAIQDYFITLGRAKPYSTFRKQRLKMKDPYQLTYYLKNYSELGYAYVSMLNLLIRENKLTQYDTLQVDPSYFDDHNPFILMSSEWIKP